MTVDIDTLPNNTIELKVIIASLQEQLSFLQEQVNMYRAQIFGRKSEKRRPERTETDQPSLFDEAEEEVAAAAQPSEESAEETVQVASHTRKRGGRRKLPENLEREEIVHDLSDEERVCACGCTMERIGEETSEELVVIPAQAKVRRHIRPKYACKQCEGVESEGIHPSVKTAALPPRLIPGSIASPELLAYLLVSKFEDALPFYRQEKMFLRIGVELSRATMCRWAVQVYERLGPMLKMMYKDLLSGPLIGMDETTVQVMKEPGRENTTKSYMWVARGGPPGKPILLYRYYPGRSGNIPQNFLAEYHGILQTDGYKGYNAVGTREDIRHAGCWAHARRKFVEVSKALKKPPASVIMVLDQYIGKLYAIEKEARKLNSADEVYRLRQEKSKPIVAAFFEWAEEKARQVTPKSKMGEAIAYALNMKPRLLLFLEDGRIPIDNNLVENAIRPFVVGRKNWLFSGSPHGAEASASIYSIIETAKANGLNPYWYLRHLFDLLAYAESEDDFRQLLPYVVTKDRMAERLMRTWAN